MVIAQITAPWTSAFSHFRFGCGGRSHQGDEFVPLRTQASKQMAAHEAGDAAEECFHLVHHEEFYSIATI